MNIFGKGSHAGGGGAREGRGGVRLELVLPNFSIKNYTKPNMSVRLC